MGEVRKNGSEKPEKRGIKFFAVEERFKTWWDLRFKYKCRSWDEFFDKVLDVLIALDRVSNGSMFSLAKEINKVFEEKERLEQEMEKLKREKVKLEREINELREMLNQLVSTLGEVLGAMGKS